MRAVRPVSVPAQSGHVLVPSDTGFYNAPGYPGGTADKAGTALTDGSGITVASNTTYSYYKNLGLGDLGQPATPIHNVTFVGCLWETSGYLGNNIALRSDGPITFRYCTMRPTGKTDNTAPVGQLEGYQFALVADGTEASPGTWNSYHGDILRLENCDIWGFSNATKCSESNASRPLIYEGCWVHNARTNDDGQDHTDGIGAPGGGTGSYVTVNRCRIESIGDTNGLAWQNTLPGGFASSWDHFTITNNLIGGYGYTISLVGGTNASPSPATNVTFTDNTYSTLYLPDWSPLYEATFATSAGSTWRRNRWRVPAGAAWGSPTHDGWYWMPVSTQRSGVDDTPYVSLSDFTG